MKRNGTICSFTGVECWHPDESRVINIRLSDMGLRGPFPIGIRSCTSLSGLDLSSNILTGQLPSNVTDVLPFVTSLDLSNNDLSGSIPPSIANLSYINLLRLNNNQLTGHIPPELSKLHRLKEFSVANNRLSGEVPVFRNLTVSAESYANNLGLCGGPLSPCKHENHVDLFFSGFAVGLPVSTILTVLLIFCCLPEPTIRRYYLLMIKKIKEREHHLVPRVLQAVVAIENNIEQSKVTDLEKYIRPMSLVELKMATNDFDTKNVIGPQVEGKKMGWTLGLRIAVGIARGLAWLHHNNVLRVAHLEISSNCVLLDDKFEPKISNFGNSNLLTSTNSTISSGCNFVVPHSSVDPYKEDVYGFGILLFEIISGKERPSAETDTHSLIYNICSEQCNMIDECLTGQGFDDEIYETLRIADSCIRTHKDGATSMLQVYQAIRAIGISRNEISIDSDYKDKQPSEGRSSSSEATLLPKGFRRIKTSEDSPLQPPKKKTKTKTSEVNPLTKTVAEYFYSTKGADNRHAGLRTTKITYRESETTPYFSSAALNAKDHPEP
ncbi:hypothetical protein E3N88_07529 [Mikania micrantha]|uniref:Protein kinase domain-containing protein n=1 Tax=Mikania micrantha TaxID=192012 RepID=A0A5N6PRS1_9ASTR|nr:hypothetical protein E3N88_07529 [Mikania micrantha]